MSENVLFVRSEEDDDGDPWDDTLLIKAYDAALARAKKEVLKGEPGGSGNTKPGGPTKWRRGHFCRAKFAEDDVWYEANILKINGDTAFIRYVGYGNSENVSLKDLELSQGNPARRAQKKEARKSRVSESGQDEPMIVDGYLSTSESGTSSRHKSHLPPPRNMETHSWSQPLQPPSGAAPWGESMPPPPPPPPGLFHGQRRPGDDETLHAMLMSWYMSGYHTGYYEGRKASKV